jgi:hypothetical protein
VPPVRFPRLSLPRAPPHPGGGAPPPLLAGAVVMAVGWQRFWLAAPIDAQGITHCSTLLLDEDRRVCPATDQVASHLWAKTSRRAWGMPFCHAPPPRRRRAPRSPFAFFLSVCAPPAVAHPPLLAGAVVGWQRFWLAAPLRRPRTLRFLIGPKGPHTCGMS